MPYPRKLLNDHETVAVDLHPHPWFFAGPVAVLLGAIALGIVTLVFTDGGSNARIGLGWLSMAALLLAVVWVIIRYLRWATTNFVITSDRVIYRSGVLAKSGVEIPLDRVNTVHFSQRIFERILGAGDLVIESGGEDGQQRFADIRDPGRVQREIHVQVEQVGRRRFSGATTASDVDLATQLEKLEGMLDRGTLTQQEFDLQKARLLGD